MLFRPWLIKLSLFWLLSVVTGNAYAASYTFPGGPLPGGCSSSGATVTCSGYLNLGNSDSITVSSPTTWVFGNGGFNGASINVGGSPADLTIDMSGSLNVGNNTDVVANIEASNIYASGGNLTWVGDIDVTGAANLNGNNLDYTGNITASSMQLGSNGEVNGNLQASGTLTIGSGTEVTGNVDGGTVNINQNATVNGPVTATNNVNMSQGSTVNGNIEATNNLNASSNNVTINGNVEVGNNANLGNNMDLDGSVTSGGDLNMSGNGNISGDVNGHNINIGNGSYIGGSVDSEGQVSNQGTINGNVNSDGPVYTDNGTINGYVNAPNEEQVGNTGNVGGPVCDQNSNEGPCSGGGGGVDHYRIEHSGQLLTCEAETVTIRACEDAGCTTESTLTGGVTLVATSGSSTNFNSSFSASTTASAAVELSTPGSYTLSLSTVPEAAANATQCQSPSGCTLEVVDTALRWQSIPTQTAGTAFTTVLEAIRTDTDTGACATALTGVSEIDVSVECLDPGSCSSGGSLLSVAGTAASEYPTYTAVTASFGGTGTASLNTELEDVGQIRLYASAQANNGDTLAGVSNAFVVRPASINVAVSGPGGYSAGIFAKTGEDFSVVLTARSSSGQVTPNFGNETSPETLTLAPSGTAVVPSGGYSGDISLVAPFSKTGAGEFSSSQVRYSEVGTARFTARVSSLDYLGTGNVSTVSADIGRFIPWQFELVDAWVTPACQNLSDPFTYMSQPLELSLEVLAENRGGNTTLNYPDVGTGATVMLSARDEAGDSDISDRLGGDSFTPVWDEGEAIVAAQAFQVDRDSSGDPDGPFDVRIGIMLDDNETGGSYTVVADPDFKADESDCTTPDNCNAIAVDDTQDVRFGLAVVPDTFGPENEALPILVTTQYWQGSYFIRNVDDNCTEIEPADISILSNANSLSTSADGATASLITGRNYYPDLFWTAPDATGAILFELDVPAWLQNDETPSNNPRAYATFGRQDGHDRITVWKEVYN
ncbi:MAG: polymer-forming cytoskeletal protein [Pseudohongiella nitratireducens]|nr:polymer-forming cytoskeletal protein [Pseudohongiella nitratireducens]